MTARESIAMPAAAVRGRTGAARPPSAERGAVLVIALVLLAVLTLIGVTGMMTSSLEEKMASNSQEIAVAFEAAESGAAEAMNTSSMFNLNATQSLATANIGSSSATRSVTVKFVGWSAPPIGSGYSATSFSAAHFSIDSTGKSGGSAQTTVSQGAYQIAPKL